VDPQQAQIRLVISTNPTTQLQLEYFLITSKKEMANQPLGYHHMRIILNYQMDLDGEIFTLMVLLIVMV
jgi:hypothetical protein